MSVEIYSTATDTDSGQITVVRKDGPSAHKVTKEIAVGNAPRGLGIVPGERYLLVSNSGSNTVIWHRPRMRRLFGVEYLLEAYKPARTRQCGYFGMPVLAGTEITGRIAVRVSKGHAHVEGYQVADGHDPDPLHSALQTLCEWGGAREVPLFSAVTPSAGAVS